MEDSENKRRIWRDPREYKTYRNGGDPQEYRTFRDRQDLQDYDPERDGGLRRNDPYRGMGSASDDTRPDFLKDPKGTASGEHKNGNDGGASEIAGGDGGSNKNSEKNREAARDLASAEEGASGAPKNTEDNLNGARENEENAEGFYSGKGRENDGKIKLKRGQKGFKGFLKKRAPMLAIFATICGIGGAMFGAQSLLPFAIEELIIEKFNSIGVSSTIVSDEMLDLQLNQGIRQGAPDPSNTNTLFGLSEYQVNQFRINGIDAYNIDVGGTSGAIMLYKKHANTIAIPVVGSNILEIASEKDIRDEVSKVSGVDFAIIQEPIGVSDALDDKDFYVPYNSASKVWRNGTSSWFDKIMKSVTEIKLNVTRSRWSNFIARSISNAGDDMKVQFNNTAAGVGEVTDKGVDIKKEEPIYDNITKYNEANEPVGTERVPIGTEEVSEGTFKYEGNEYKDETISKSTTADQISGILNSKAVRAAQTASKVACGAVNAAIVIYSTVQAHQALQFLNLVSGFLEAVDRVKAGDGDTSPMMEYTANLTTAANTYDNNGTVVAKNRTAIASAGLSWLFGGNNPINSNDQSVQNTNIESLMKKVELGLSDASTLTKAMEVCGYAAIASEAIDFAADAVLLVASFGVGNVLKFFIKKAAGLAIGLAVSAVVGVMVEGAIRQILRLFINNVATEWFGEDLGNALVSGASRYLGGNGTSGGQGPGTREAVTAYLVSQQDVIAREAEYQREVRSPFDIRSKYTFLGSLAYSILPLAYSGGNLISVLTNVAGTASSAMTAMLPTASAIEANNSLSSVGDCPLLEEAGIVGDAFCNPYVITDVSTTNLFVTTDDMGGEIASVGHSGVKESHFDNNGQIKKDSDLSRYITYCGQRVSQYNIYDATIASQVTGSGDKNNTARIIGQNVPLVSNIINIVENAKLEANMDWVNGRECIVGGSHWGDNKYFQRYTENERLLEGMNPDYTSPVTAYLEDYYEENPLDTSFEGTLARFSGQTKEDVVFALDLIDYYEFLDNYDPSSRYAFVKEEEPETVYYESDTRFTVISKALASELFMVVYPELRSRYYTV